MTELPHEVTEALAELARAAESYGRWCSPAHLHELRTARQSAEKVIASTLQSREEPSPKYCKACGAAPGEDCNTASTLEVPRDCINRETP